MARKLVAEFFQTLQSWGADDTRHFVIFHYSILSEGINVPGLTHTILLRNLPIIEMAQTIGRVIRVHKDDRAAVAEGRIPAGAFHLYKKSEGVVICQLDTKWATLLLNVCKMLSMLSLLKVARPWHFADAVPVW